jgi:flavin reductase (DIM6/NTAB) family NADH-FMN oxidoreductase RutF
MVRMRSVPVSPDRSLWDQFFAVFPLVIIGSKEPDGTFDLAPKHMAIPLGWENHYGFVCTPRHATYRNIEREGQFTVSYPLPSQVVTSSLAASPRCDDRTKPALSALSTRPAAVVDGVLVEDCYLHLECTRERLIDGFGGESLIVGLVVAAWVEEEFLRITERDEGEQLFRHPLLAYIHPGRYAEIRQTAQFPFPRGFSR